MTRPTAMAPEASTSPVGQWQPIETAPTKHLSRFLAYAAPRSDDEQVIYEVRRYDDRWGNQIRLNDGYGSTSERDILGRLTHWMPFPPTPEVSHVG